ncbi:unnamed protein product [Larinioides sclopetarius]|uniref:Uncharacterized protein n=1 Tax=Larinioides sclopetarius TaxID=280406 RepID=A0AAV1ZKJ3_9ARAC
MMLPQGYTRDFRTEIALTGLLSNCRDRCWCLCLNLMLNR